MCEFTVLVDGEKVAERVIKAMVKDDGTVVMSDIAGHMTRVEDARIRKVDTIMTELILERNGTSP